MTLFSIWKTAAINTEETLKITINSMCTQSLLKQSSSFPLPLEVSDLIGKSDLEQNVGEEAALISVLILHIFQSD